MHSISIVTLEYNPITDNSLEAYVSTSNTFDMGWETMVFPCINEEVISWVEIDFLTRHYSCKEDAIKGHKAIIDLVIESSARILKEF